MTVSDLKIDIYYLVVCGDVILRAQYVGANGAGVHTFSASIPDYFCNHLVDVEPWEIERRVFESNSKLVTFIKLFGALRR